MVNKVYLLKKKKKKERKLLNKFRAIFIVRVASLNVREMLSVPEITAFCML